MLVERESSLLKKIIDVPYLETDSERKDETQKETMEAKEFSKGPGLELFQNEFHFISCLRDIESKNVVAKNTGSTVLYYEWQRNEQNDPKSSKSGA